MVCLFTKVAQIHAAGLAEPLLHDDRAAVKGMLKALISHEFISYAFVGKERQVYVHVPEGSLPGGQPVWDRSVAGIQAVKTLKDKNGEFFYDISLPILGTDATFHLLLSRDAIDRHVQSTVLMKVVLLGFGAVLGVSILSLLFSSWATREVDRLTKTLDEERKQLLSIFDSMPEIIYVIDPNSYEILYANRALCEAFRKDIIGGLCYKELYGRSSPCDFCINSILLKDRDKIVREERFNPILNRYFWVTDRIIKWTDGRDVRFSIAINITDRKIAEERLKKSEERYRELINTSIDGIISVNSKMEIILWNPAAERIFGYTEEEILGQSLLTIVPKRFWASGKSKFSEFMKKDVGHLIQVYGLRKDGTEVPIELSISSRREGDSYIATAIVRDISDRKKLQEQLRQAQKMEAIGTLAGGIAHDFNNLLTVINGHAEIALMKAGKAHPLQRDIELIKKAGKKAAQLVNQLLAFSRKQMYEPRIVDINKIIIGLEKMLRRLISEDIILEKVLAEDLPPILADPTQIEQILINLVVNARDAIYEHTDPQAEKKITIETNYVFLDESYVATHPGSQVGPHVLISVSDTGIGMDEETQRRIFEPFFSTKGVGRGTGLGLATVYGIVKQNNGSIYVYSELGRGATFKIYWPTSGEEVSPEMTNSPKEILGGSEKIFVVEDNEMVKDFISTTLSQLGYQVFEASNGKEALELIRQKGLQIDLLITDLIMPEMSGDELARKIKEMYPDIAVIYISGYTDNHVVQNGMLKEGVDFLQKPFTIQQLSQKVREVLGRACKNE